MTAQASAESKEGQVAFVTGAASGFGRGLTRALAGRGVRVLACDIDEAGGREVADLTGALFVPCDVSDPAQNAHAVTTAVEQFGGLDMAFLNAGIASGTGLGEEFDLALYRRAMERTWTASSSASTP